MSSEPSDDSIVRVRAAIAGDDDGLAWLVERYTPLLLAQAKNRIGRELGRVVGADDLVQEVWAIALPKLRLFADRPESVTLRLLDRGIAHEVTERRLRVDAEHVRPYPGLRFEFGDQEFDVTVFPLDGIRQAPVSPVDGKPMRRADADEVEVLLAAGESGAQ